MKQLSQVIPEKTTLLARKAPSDFLNKRPQSFKKQQDHGDMYILDLLLAIILWLMIAGLIVSLFTMIFLGYPSVGLFFIFLGIVLLAMLAFGIFMLGDRTPNVGKYEQ